MSEAKDGSTKAWLLEQMEEKRDSDVRLMATTQQLHLIRPELARWDRAMLLLEQLPDEPEGYT